MVRLAVVAAQLAVALVVGGAQSTTAQAAGATSRFVALEPCRLADVRDGSGFERVDSRTVRVFVPDRCGVPQDASSVALTVTVDNGGRHDAGHISIWPEGAPQPLASIVNYGPGEIRANGTMVAIGIGGAIDLFAYSGAPVIVDVTGYFSLTTSSSSGRLIPITPARAVDTRLAPRSAPMAPGETIHVPLPPGVPTDAAAVAVTVTLTESAAAGFFTVFPSGGQLPPTSTVNADGRGQTRAAGAIVGVTPAGLDVLSSHGGHVIIDVTGWFTGESAASSTDGLFVAEQAPRRLLDTRGGDPIWPGGTVEIGNVAPNAAALALNVTIVQPIAPGHLTSYPARNSMPPTSSVNGGGRSDVAAAMTITPTSTAGVAIFAVSGADTVVDLSGWFVGQPMSAPGTPSNNVRPARCASSTDPAGLNDLFKSNALFFGADYQRPFQLPDGRVLWLFQDVAIADGSGNSRLIHNAGLIQSGRCFDVLVSGDRANPNEYLFPDATSRFRHWFWPLAGEMGSDGRFHLFVAEMRENGPSYLTQTEPIATWVVTIDLSTLQVVDRRPAVNSSAALYGWSVASDAKYTYLYAHCHRQFGWDPFPFVSPPEYVHDFDCVQRMTVARVPKGRFDVPLSYWNGSSWVANPAAAVNVVPTGRFVSASQMYLVDGKWVSITKVGDWFGTRIEIDVASNPQGPYTTVRSIATPAKCSNCNTYFASLMPFRGSDGSLLIGLSNNVFGALDLSRYDPTFFATPVV